MSKYITFPILYLLLSSCSSPMLSISAKDSRGGALPSFPLRIGFGEGIERSFRPLSVDSELPQQIVQESDKSYRVTTNSVGEVRIPYRFIEKQPNGLLLLFGAERLSDKDIEITPLRDLPKGSRITLSIPNP